MIPIKSGQIVKFSTILEGENPNQQYVVLEIHDDPILPRAKIKALNTGLAFPPVTLAKPNDLIVVDVQTQDLLGQIVYAKTSNGDKVLGKVLNVNNDYVNLDMEKIDGGIQTNVIITVVDKDGQEHVGTLVVSL